MSQTYLIFGEVKLWSSWCFDKTNVRVISNTKYLDLKYFSIILIFFRPRQTWLKVDRRMLKIIQTWFYANECYYWSYFGGEEGSILKSGQDNANIMIYLLELSQSRGFKKAMKTCNCHCIPYWLVYQINVKYTTKTSIMHCWRRKWFTAEEDNLKKKIFTS